MTTKLNDYSKIITENREQFERFLAIHLEKINCPEPLNNSIIYSLNAGGKRLRPVLFRLAHKNYSDISEEANIFSLAVECIHTYSLIHDDLPIIDNDDFRRGKPSNHKIFGEDIALLAGDGLLNYAYELISGVLLKNNCNRIIKAFYELATASGINGMIGGQTVDVCAEKSLKTLKTEHSKELLEYIHNNKTSRLITAAIVCGAQIGGAASEDIEHIRDYGKNLGMLFQITDDILDVTGDIETLGKTTGKDINKLTYPGLFGMEQARKAAEEYRDKAVESIRNIKNSEIFKYICDTVVVRNT